MDLPPKFTDFPTRENCDPTNPYQAFLWMLVALPYQQGGQLVMPVDYLQLVSKRIWDCGARPVAEPVVKYVKPSGSEPNWLTTPGKWVSPDSVEPPPNPVRKALDTLTVQQRAEILAELKREQAELP